MARFRPRLLSNDPHDSQGSCQGPPESDDPRALFQLQVLEDLEEEKTLLYRFICVAELIALAILSRQLLLILLGP